MPKSEPGTTRSPGAAPAAGTFPAGTYVALCTPFLADGSAVDFASFDRLVGHCLVGGVDGVVACGSTGEGLSLTAEEYRAVVARAVDLCRGRARVLGGISLSSTAAACEAAALLGRLGADGALVASPPYVKPGPEGLAAHFGAVAAAGPPVMAYNIPGRTGSVIPTGVLASLYGRGLIAGVKDSTGSVDGLLDLFVAAPGLPVFSGEDSLVQVACCAGGTGAVSATANLVPAAVCGIVRSAREGTCAGASARQLALLPLVRALFAETNPGPLKAALADAGVIARDALRLPLTTPSPSLREKISVLMKEISSADGGPPGWTDGAGCTTEHV